MIALSHTCPRYLLLLLLTTLWAGACPAWSQASKPPVVDLKTAVPRDLELIHQAEHDRLPASQQGSLWIQLALHYQAATEFQKAEDAYNKGLPLLNTDPSTRPNYATALDDLASLYLIYGRLDDAENARKQALAVRKKMGSADEVALSEVHLADIALARHQFKKAERLSSQGLTEMESSPKPSTTGMLSAFITMTYARCSLNHCDQGLTNARQAAAFAGTHFAAESVPVGFALETLGFAEWKNGAIADGEKAMLQGLQILRAQLDPADPRLGGAMLQYQAYLTATNRQEEAKLVHEEVTRITSRTGIVCSGCTVSVNTLSNTLR